MPKTQITLRDSFEMTFKNKCDENFMKWKENVNKMPFYMEY